MHSRQGCRKFCKFCFALLCWPKCNLCLSPSPNLSNAVQEGLKGNRVVEPSLWALVLALERAFPVLLGPTMAAVRLRLPDAALQPEQALRLWLLQVHASSHKAAVS